jgi:hypothetical protein
MKGLSGVLLLGGFLWLGVPRGSEVEFLEKQDRQQVAFLCRMVLLEHFLDAKPEALSVAEWRAVLAEYRAASALDDADLASPNPTFPGHGSAVIDRLVARLRGR